MESSLSYSYFISHKGPPPVSTRGGYLIKHMGAFIFHSITTTILAVNLTWGLVLITRFSGTAYKV